MAGALRDAAVRGLGPRDQRAVRELSARLGTLRTPHDRALPDVVPALSAAIGAEIDISYSVGIEGDTPTLTGYVSRALPAGFERELASFVGASPIRFAAYHAGRPEPWQRNRALRRDEVTPTLGASPMGRELWPRLGIERYDQLRLLVCDGSSLLAWVGGLRREPFCERERGLLQSLASPLRARLRLERQLDEGMLGIASLSAALEAIPAAAFLLGPRGTLRHANGPGRAWLEREGPPLRARLREAALRGASGFTLTAVEAPGLPRHTLAVAQAPARDLGALLLLASARFRLTPRETQVLAGLARGQANKTLACDLRISEATVEVHVTHLFAKTGTGSRGELAALVWTLG
ncbi:MAG: helix-turn-helix transcriptional regulator [Deltaproteobacteria bacterium]